MCIANFETKTKLGIKELLMSLRFGNSPIAYMKMRRISESGH